jgi:uncharacterized protein (DUF302 family)
MRILKLASVLILALSISSCSSMMSKMMKNKMFKHYTSKYSFNETVNKLEKSIKESPDWELLEVKSNTETYKNEGELPNYTELHICLPPVAYQIISNDKTQFMAAMIPLQLCIYETSEKEVKISVMNTNMMSKMFRDKNVKESIKKSSEALKELLESVEK